MPLLYSSLGPRRSAPSIHSAQEQVWWANSIKLRLAVWGGLSAGSAALAAVAVLVRGRAPAMSSSCAQGAR